MNNVGSRLQCEQCGSQLIVTRAGSGSLRCCGAELKPSGSAGAAGPAAPSRPS